MDEIICMIAENNLESILEDDYYLKKISYKLQSDFEANFKKEELDVVSKIKSNLPDIVDEFMEEIERRSAGDYRAYSY